MGGSFSFDISVAPFGARSMRVDTDMHGCRYAYGDVSLSDVAMFAGAAAKQANEEDGWFEEDHVDERDANGRPPQFVSSDPMVISQRLAGLTGAIVVWGRTSAVNAACEAIYVRRRKEIGDFLGVPVEGQATRPPALLEWLASGDQGASTLAILREIDPALVRFHRRCEPRLPRDLESFIRCRKLLETEPIHRSQVFAVMKTKPGWLPLVDAWSSIEASMDAEQPQWRTNESGLRKTEALFDSVVQASAVAAE